MTKFVDRYVEGIRKLVERPQNQTQPSVEQFREELEAMIRDLIARAENIVERVPDIPEGHMEQQLRNSLRGNISPDKPNRLVSQYGSAIRRYKYVSDLFEQETRADVAEKNRLLKYRVGTALLVGGVVFLYSWLASVVGIRLPLQPLNPQTAVVSAALEPQVPKQEALVAKEQKKVPLTQEVQLDPSEKEGAAEVAK